MYFGGILLGKWGKIHTFLFLCSIYKAIYHWPTEVIKSHYVWYSIYFITRIYWWHYINILDAGCHATDIGNIMREVLCKRLRISCKLEKGCLISLVYLWLWFHVLLVLILNNEFPVVWVMFDDGDRIHDAYFHTGYFWPFVFLVTSLHVWMCYWFNAVHPNAHCWSRWLYNSPSIYLCRDSSLVTCYQWICVL